MRLVQPEYKKEDNREVEKGSSLKPQEQDTLD